MKRLFALFTALCLMLCSCALPTDQSDPQNSYSRACALLNDGDLEEAYALFLSLGDYKDSEEYAEKFVYLPTEILAEDDGFGEDLALYKTTYSYNEKGQLLEGEGAYTKGDGPGYTEAHTYDDEGLLIKSKISGEAGDSTLTYEYNSQGLCLKRIGFTEGANLGGVTLFTYENGLKKTATVRSYLGIDTESYASEEPYHQTVMTYFYDEAGRCIKAEEDNGENGIFTYTISYNKWGLPSAFAYSDTSEITSQTLFDYDEEGRCIKVTASHETIEFTYGEGDHPRSAIRTRDGGAPCDITYQYQLFYMEDAPQFPAHLSEYLSGLEV